MLDNAAYVMTFLFTIGYILIILEHLSHINKAAVALLMASLCWMVQFFIARDSLQENLFAFGLHFSEISQIVFFLLGALTIVEIIGVHKGFRTLADYIQIRSKRKLLFIVGALAFFLSAVLDNLTTTIVMLTLLSRLMDCGEDRLLMGSGIVIAANAGGAWSPIGDVTTTMLWIGGQISSLKIIYSLFFPSLICTLVSLFILSFQLKGDLSKTEANSNKLKREPRGRIIFYLGIALLAAVPIFKYLTGLPPFMGVLFGVGVLWLVTDLLHYRHMEREHLRVPYVLSKVDMSSTLFFLGVLLAVNALETAGILHHLSLWLDHTIKNLEVLAFCIGIASAIVDNVPLVAATMGMYDLIRFPIDAPLWHWIAYCAGTGGSLLIIGSAAGVVFMGMERVSFFWYVKRITPVALAGYLSGLLVKLLL